MDDRPARFVLHAGCDRATRLRRLGGRDCQPVSTRSQARSPRPRVEQPRIGRGTPSPAASAGCCTPSTRPVTSSSSSPRRSRRPTGSIRLFEQQPGSEPATSGSGTSSSTSTTSRRTSPSTPRCSGSGSAIGWTRRCTSSAAIARHHSIGVAHLTGPPRVLHVMLEVERFDDVGRGARPVPGARIRVSMLGLHTNDRMTSFYLQTPSGFEVEYGWNGLLVDDATWQTAVIDRPSVSATTNSIPSTRPGRRAFRPRHALSEMIASTSTGMFIGSSDTPTADRGATHARCRRPR